MSGLSDRELRERIIEDPEAGWRAFVDQYTPRLLQLIETCGVRDRDDAMDLYVHVCERLAADDCSRLRKHDPAKGSLSAWLGTVVRRMLVDWVRGNAGRKRLFGSIRALPAVDQQVFELYYWRRQPPSAIADLITGENGAGIGLAAVFASLERVERALTERQRLDLMTMTARSSAAMPLMNEEGEPLVEVTTSSPDPESALLTASRDRALNDALQALPVEDRVIVSMRYLDGLTLPEIRRALHLDALSMERVGAIVTTLRQLLERQEGTRQ
jgi:DNA-directed RNA polymerase specialized sigma24 family protein